MLQQCGMALIELSLFMVFIEIMEETPKLPKTPPRPKKAEDIKESTQSQFQPTEALIYRQEFERAIKYVDERIANTNFIMGVIIVILLVGFLTLLVSVVGIFGQYIGLKANSDVQVINSINELKKQLNDNQIKFNLHYEKKEATSSGQ